MLVLFETPAGYAIFKLLDEKKLLEADDLYKDFETPEKASKVVKLKHFKKFEDTTEALAAITASVEGKMSKSLKKMMKKVVSKEIHDELAVADAKIGNIIKDKYDLQCVSNSAIHELMRGIRSQMTNLIPGISEKEVSAMALGLAHSLSRYKLKFSPDKVDTMIVQAISLLDELDKELNNYVMRCREWYGWHFPEMGKIVTDNMAYARTVKEMGMKTNIAGMDLSKILPEEVEEELKQAAEISMGTEISVEDMDNISYLCEQIIQISEYRAQLYDYLKNRMQAIAPNLTVLVGELVGARLIAHAGSLLNLAKHPSSTVQILGAEKALFRALKTKHDTPKYGLIYHASLVGQGNQKNKGKISRMLAAKTALAIRYDALGEGETSVEMGILNRAKLEERIRALEEGKQRRISGTGKMKAKPEKFENQSEIRTYNPVTDSTIGKGKRKREEMEAENDEQTEETVSVAKKVKKEKKKKKEKVKEELEESPAITEIKTEVKTEDEEMATPDAGEKKKKKKKKKKADDDDDE